VTDPLEERGIQHPRTALVEKGYEIINAVLVPEEIEPLRAEADRIASSMGSACVRHLRGRSSIFAALACDSRLLGLIPNGHIPVRSILFDKTADRNWPVQWHQDLTIAVREVVDVPGYGPWSIKDGVAHVQPPVEVLQAMVTLRIHLDDATAENGALRVCSGSHLSGRIPQAQISTLVAEGEVLCECRAGDVLVMAPLVLHASRRAKVPGRRRVVHFGSSKEFVGQNGTSKGRPGESVTRGDRRRRELVLEDPSPPLARLHESTARFLHRMWAREPSPLGLRTDAEYGR